MAQTFAVVLQGPLLVRFSVLAVPLRLGEAAARREENTVAQACVGEAKRDPVSGHALAEESDVDVVFGVVAGVVAAWYEYVCICKVVSDILFVERDAVFEDVTYLQ